MGLVLADAPGSSVTTTWHRTRRRATAGSLVTAFAAWLVMAGAMMLPTVVPLVRLFVPVTARVPRPVATRLAFLGGYLAVWGGFAAVAMLGDSGVGGTRPVRTWPVAPSELVLGVTLVVAGLFQFSRLKHACLTACRSPWALPLAALPPRRPRRLGCWASATASLCLGCCWALMLIMFGAGVGSLLWMLALTGFMIVEKTAPYGARWWPRWVARWCWPAPPSPSWPSRPISPGGSARSDGAVDPGMVALLLAAIGLAVLRPTWKAGRPTG